MSAVTFDTLKFVETLEEAGVENRVAKAISSAVRDSYDAADLATKADLREMELRMDAKFERSDAKIGALYAEINSIKWMIGLLLAAVMTILIKSFF